MRFGELIQSYIKYNYMTYRQFGDMCGVSPGYLSMLINNNNPRTGKPPIPSLSTYMNIGRAMGMTLDELFSRIDDAPVSLSVDVDDSDGLSKLSADEVRLITAYRTADPVYQEIALEILENHQAEKKKNHA